MKKKKKEEEEEEKRERGTFFRKRERKENERRRKERRPKKLCVCVVQERRRRENKFKKEKQFSSTLFTSTHTTNVRIVVPSSVFILHENKNNRVLRIRILRMTEVPTKVVAFEKENVSSKGVPNLPSPPSPLGDEIQNDELDEEEEEEEERATIEEAAIEKTKEQNDDKEEEEEEEEDFIRIKRRVRGTNEKEEEEEEEEEVIDDAADIDAKKTNDKEEEREDVNNNNTVEKSFKKKTLKHKSGERVEKVASKKNTSGQGDEEKAEEGDKFEFELEEEEEEEEMEEDDDEERILERRFAETGRLSEDEEEDEESESELNFSSSEEEENESSSDSEVEDNEGGRRRRGGRKTTKKGGGKKKKAIDPNDKEAVMRQKKEEADEAHEKLMRKTAKHVHFPGYRVQAERTSFLPVIEKLQNNLRMVENDENLRARYPRPPPSPEKKEFQAEEDAEGAVNDGVNEEVSEDEGEDGGKEKTNFDEIDSMDLLSEEEEEEEMIELEEESDSDDEVAAAELIRTLSAKKTMKVVVNDPAHAEDKDNTAKENQDDEDGDEDDGELSEEEDMTGKERREQRKLARNFYKEDRKNQKKERRSKKATEGVDDEAEMSEDGGHTDDDDEDDIETARAEIDEMADFVDFREGTALDNDERRNEARRDAHAKRAIQEDEEDIKKMKELLENGFKRPKKGLNGEEDDDGKWKTRRTQERGDDSESESDSDDLRNLRPEEAVEVSDDEDEGAKAFKERQAQRFSMKKASGGDTQEPNENEALPEVGEGKVSMEVMKLFEKEKNKKSTKYNNKGQGTTQSQTIASDLSNRGGGGSGSGLSRGNSQFSNLGAARTSSTSFLKRNGSSKSQSGFAKGIISGGAASRTFVFGSALDNSNSQWATTQRETETMPSSLGNNLLGGDEARTGFGDDVANNNINSSASVRENKKKSLFSMLQKSTKDEDWEKDDDQGQGIKNVLGM